METRRRGPVTGAEIEREKRDRRERRAALDARPLPKRLKGVKGFEETATEESGPRTSSAPLPESASRGELVAAAIHLKYLALDQLDRQDPDSAEVTRELSRRWDEVKDALDGDPDADMDAAMNTVSSALQNAERRTQAVKDRKASEEAALLKKILSAIRRAA